METTGYFRELRRLKDGTQVIAFTVDSQVDAEEVKAGRLNIKATAYREKRSLDANAYFHVLVDKLRTALRISFTSCKNYLITSYGQIEYIDDVPAVIKTNLPPDRMAEHETVHCKPVRVDVDNGKEIWFYRLYRGSHTYTRTEMSMLIDGTVEECKAQGIETLSPDRLEEMKAAWAKSHA